MQNSALDKAAWLREHSVLVTLSSAALSGLVEALEVTTVAANRRIVLEDSPPEALYILKAGRLESYRTSPTGPASASSLLAGAVIHLPELLMGGNARNTVITLTESELWAVSAASFQALVARFPEISQAFSRQLATELVQLSTQLSFEQERAAALRPYLITRARRGIVGKSRYAVALRVAIRKAALDREAVLIFGEPGLEKDNIAALVHFGSPSRRTPVIQLNCAALQPSGADLFGRRGGKTGLIAWLGEGTLILNNVHDLPNPLAIKIAELIETGRYRPVSPAGTEAGEPGVSHARIVMVAEKTVPLLERMAGHLIKVPPLRVRKADIEAQVEYYLNIMERSEGISRPRVAPEALRRLQGYDFPGNLSELKNLLERAVSQADGKELNEEVFWPAQARKKIFRYNLLNAFPQLRRFLRSEWWPDRLNSFILVFFVFIVAVLFLGPQRRAENFALSLFWAWWWPLILVGFPFVGRLWCAVCPFMIWGELVQKVSLWLWPRSLGRWPREGAERWGGWFLFGLFALIFLWEELWNLQDTAALSAWLLLLITGGAIVCSLFFERRFWCRYLCPIGGMNGLFAKLSMTELRAQQGICSATCTTYQCYKGGPQKGEGQASAGCPLYSHPAQLQDNRDCVLCMTCLKACPHRSVEFNLRPPGIELWTTHTPRTYEVALLLLLLGGVFLHRLPELTARFGWQTADASFLTHLALSLLVLTVPALIPLISHSLVKLFAPRGTVQPFTHLAYGYLPLVLGGTLAHYLNLGLEEAGRLLPITWLTFGANAAQLPVLIAHPAVIAFLQGTLLICSVLLTFWLTQKIARQSLRLLLPQHLGALVLGASLWTLIVTG